MTPHLGDLTLAPALDHPGLLAPVVVEALAQWFRNGEVTVSPISADLADTAAFSEAYRVPLTSSANCVVVAGKREGVERIAACVVRADTRVDVNNAVKGLLHVRKASFLAMERATKESQMEYGGINPIGLPASWRLLIDSRVLDIEAVLIGSGTRSAKIVLPGAALGDLPRAKVVEGLALPAQEGEGAGGVHRRNPSR